MGPAGAAVLRDAAMEGRCRNTKMSQLQMRHQIHCPAIFPLHILLVAENAHVVGAIDVGPGETGGQARLGNVLVGARRCHHFLDLNVGQRNKDQREKQ